MLHGMEYEEPIFGYFRGTGDSLSVKRKLQDWGVDRKLSGVMALTDGAKNNWTFCSLYAVPSKTFNS